VVLVRLLFDELDEPHASSKTATTAVPMSVGGWVNTTPLLVSRACSASMSSRAN
jgi:hypothetical protein